MEFIKKITSPLRKHNVYSSQRHLVDTEASSNNEKDNDTDEGNEVSLNTRHKKDSNENNKKFLKSLRTNQSNKFQRESFEMKSTDLNNFSDNSNSVNVSLKDKKLTSNNTSRRTSLQSLNEENKDNVVYFKESTAPNSSRSESSNIKLNNLGDRPHSSHHSSHKSNLESNIRKPNRNEKSADKVKTKNIQNLPTETINKNIEEMELKPLQRSETNIGKALKIIGVHVHKSDILRHHPFLIYPCVKIYIVNLENGKCFNNENLKNGQMNTKSFDFLKHRTIIPQWNELILFEDKIIEEIRNVLSIIIFFEIVGIQPGNNPIKDPETQQKIAWAFIKPFGSGEICNVNRKIKIQLYEMLEINDSVSDPKAYDCWKEKPWKVYPSILYVTLKGIKLHEKVDIINNMKLNIFKNKNNEQGIDTFVNTQVKADTKFAKRENGQQCKIPNKIVKYLLCKEKGTFAIKFSHCGKKLAYSSGDHDDFSIHVYKVPQFTREAKLSFHKKFVYDICWSHSSNNILITASADTTVCIWNLENTQKNLLQQLVHPTFVYSSQFCTLDETIVTGCYDKIIRVWFKHEDKHYNLDQELLGHEGFINTICFGNRSQVFYSGDSTGLIIKWSNNKHIWCKVLTIKLSEIRDHVINDLVMFPDNQRMLVILRNSVSWLLDLSTSTLFLCYKDGFEYTYQLRGSISSCGTLVFIGNCVWNASTGKLMAIYNPSLFNHQTITALDYHPYYNIFAVGCGFLPAPLIVCEFQDNQQDSNMNIELFTDSSYNVNESKDNTFYDVGINSDQIMQKRKQLPDLKVLSFRRKLAGQTGVDNTLIERNHDSKLWNLINKMDDVLLIARKGREYAEKKSNALNAEDNIYLGKYKSNHISSESENNTTISVDLTQFNEIFQLRADIHKPPTEINSDSKSDCTYTVEIHDGDSIKEVVDDSSTLSAAESLEDDLQTYTVSVNAENFSK